MLPLPYLTRLTALSRSRPRLFQASRFPPTVGPESVAIPPTPPAVEVGNLSALRINWIRISRGAPCPRPGIQTLSKRHMTSYLAPTCRLLVRPACRTLYQVLSVHAAVYAASAAGVQFNGRTGALVGVLLSDPPRRVLHHPHPRSQPHYELIFT